MSRTIEERLEEILENLDNTEPPVLPVVTKVYRLVNALLSDFKAEGIAGRVVRELSKSQQRT